MGSPDRNDEGWYSAVRVSNVLSILRRITAVSLVRRIVAMTVTLDLSAEALARLEAEAARRGVSIETIIDELASQLPPRAASAAQRSGLIGLGASSSGQRARDADAMLADGFGRS